jgi:hypothetical protein
LGLSLVFGVQDVFLEKGVFTIHVGTVKKTVAVDDVFKETFAQVVCVVIFFVFYIVLVRKNILLFARLSRLIFRFGRFIFIGLVTTLVEGLLEFA